MIAPPTIEAASRAEPDGPDARAKAEFLSAVTHELRTPLHAIVGSADFLAGEELAPAARDAVEAIREAAAGLGALLDDVIDFAALDAGRLSLDAASVDVRDLLKGVARTFRPSAWRKSLDLELTVDPATPARIDADPGRLRQILVHLVGNAVKFTERGGVWIAADLERTGPSPRLRLRVGDTGIGIPPEAFDRVFRDFAQADQGRARSHGGLGLGLALCRRLADLMGAEIGFESELGVGSTFRLLVPIAPESLEAPESAATARPSVKAVAGLKVLAADDNPVNRDALATILREAGAHATVVADGLEAVERAGREAFDVIVLDLQMPSVSGDQAARMIRAAQGREDGAAILIAASRPAEALRETGVADLADGVAPKPYAASTLIPAIAAAATSPDRRARAFETAGLEELERSVGRTTLVDILQSYLATAADVTARLARAGEGGDGAALERAGQDLAGAASGLGFAELTAAGRSLAAAARAGASTPELEAQAEALAGLVTSASAAIAELYPDLPNPG